MKQVDVLIVGAATTGSYFAHGLARAGLKVLVIDKLPRERVGTRYDIFHIADRDFERFHLPRPEKEKDYAFEFEDSDSRSAYGKYPKPGKNKVIGMHMHPYTLRMNDWAMDAGAEFIYSAAFDSLIFTPNGQVCGARYQKDRAVFEVGAKLVADCSGIPSVARRALPRTSWVENFRITPEEMFYVILRYAAYENESDYVHGSRGWPYYKTWEAPQADPKGAILGIGANIGFDTAERVYQRFTEAVALPKHTITHIERGTTPYRRPPYSFVDTGFAVLGDAACLTKPSAGEGVTSAMVQADILLDMVISLHKAGKPFTRNNLWMVNKRYIDAQGKAFASQLAMLPGAVATSARENNFFFKTDVIFSRKTFAAMGEGEEIAFTTGEIAVMAIKMLFGVLTGQLRISTIRALLKAMKDSGRIADLYARFPESPDDFEDWRNEAEKAWATCENMVEALKRFEQSPL